MISTTSEKVRPAGELTRHIPALDGVRGLAVLMVVAIHYGNLTTSHSPIIRAITIIKGMGWVGVDIFFVLSGFLITGILWETKDRPHRWKNFYVRRALRLFPLYYAVWTFLLLYVFLTHRPWQNSYFGFLLYFGNIAVHYTTSVGIFPVEHLWSLAVEEQFYLVWPFILWKIGRERTAMLFLAGIAAFSIALKLILVLAHVQGQWGYHLLPSHMEGLALGSILALAIRTPAMNSHLQFASRCLPLILVALGAVAVYFHGLNLLDNVVILFAVPLISLAATLLLSMCLIPGTLYKKAMESPVLRFYGKYSYGLYIYHVLLINVLHNSIYNPLFAKLHSSAVAGSLYLATCAVLLTGLSVVSFHIYESRFLAMKRYF